VFQSLIVLLYILDNDANFVVKCSIFVGLLIELWKVPKCMDVGVDRENKWLGVVPRVTIKDKGSYVESSTKQYDQVSTHCLSDLHGIYCSWPSAIYRGRCFRCWPAMPYIRSSIRNIAAGTGTLVIAPVCTVLYKRVINCSWVLSMLYGFLLTFGFIMMTPQLFINYKLKSVAHLPWRMLTYKFINTFIDDLFAFVIRMPTLYRLGCFRDDIVFLVLGGLTIAGLHRVAQ
jgi:hypothetical protein